MSRATRLFVQMARCCIMCMLISGVAARSSAAIQLRASTAAADSQLTRPGCARGTSG
jgi:hypothetical protein